MCLNENFKKYEDLFEFSIHAIFLTWAKLVLGYYFSVVVIYALFSFFFQEHGLVLVNEGAMNGDIIEDYIPITTGRKKSKQYSTAALLSHQSAQLLDQVGNGSLGKLLYLS